VKGTHKGLDVWKLSMDLVVEIYSLTSRFPPSEKYGLCAQMRRSSISIPSNLAEGAARRSLREYGRFISISRGSLSELDTQLDLSVRLGFMSPSKRSEIDLLLMRVDKMLHFLRESKTKGKAEHR
jgi:four helix bundle protein